MQVSSNRIKAWLVLLPTIVVALYFIWGFALYTGYLSFTKSKFLPKHTWNGVENYSALFADDRWWVAYTNMFLFGGLYLAGCIVLGAGLAMLLDRLTKGEALFRTMYLYPMSLSLVVTGLAWQWILNPTSGIQQIVRNTGYESFSFNWLVSPDYAIYTIVFAAVWNGTGLIMILFLSGIKSVDGEIWKAARIDRVPTWRVYVSIILPQLRTTLLTAVMLLGFQVVRSFDVVVALTNGGPGYASDVPARYVFEYFFQRGRIGQGAAGAVIMVVTMIMIIMPYLLYEVRRKEA
ncbi:carbohydrate ABC transporter permease [Aliiroseovarius sp. 2305UL8-7]|uniref:carbohydrate ABC transporter permease n=1 Tax=Aliiroseovarius conchicola TaxID=3121637 RepID=UPI0035283F24